MNLGDLLLHEGFRLSINDAVKHYHTKIYMPDWFNQSIVSFEQQVLKMCSPTKPFKMTDYCKIKSGYPHEVEMERKTTLIQEGCNRDLLSSKKDVKIPKMDIQDFIKLKNNIIAFTTPQDSLFIRDITVYDKDSHDDIVFIYVINRKAQVITAWSELKEKGRYKIAKPKNVIKRLKYETE